MDENPSGDLDCEAPSQPNYLLMPEEMSKSPLCILASPTFAFDNVLKAD
jgi:hypothetical protein